MEKSSSLPKLEIKPPTPKSSSNAKNTSTYPTQFPFQSPLPSSLANQNQSSTFNQNVPFAQPMTQSTPLPPSSFAQQHNLHQAQTPFALLNPFIVQPGMFKSPEQYERFLQLQEQQIKIAREQMEIQKSLDMSSGQFYPSLMTPVPPVTPLSPYQPSLFPQFPPPIQNRKSPELRSTASTPTFTVPQVANHSPTECIMILFRT